MRKGLQVLLGKAKVSVYSPWGMSAVGVLLLCVLYLLPRQVVDNAAEAAQLQADASARRGLVMHALPIGADVAMQIVRWRALWGQTQSWPWADSLAYTYLQYKRTDSALQYARALTVFDDKAALRQGALHLYRAYQQLQDSNSVQSQLGTEARKQLDAAAKHYPYDYALQVKAALTYLNTSNPMIGIGRLSQLYKAAPKDPDVLFALGRLSLQTGQYRKGEEKLRKLLQLYPAHVEGMLYLGHYLMGNEQADEGRALLEKGKRITTDPALLQVIQTYLTEEKQTR